MEAQTNHLCSPNSAGQDTSNSEGNEIQPRTFDDPIYRQLSLLNGEINRMEKDDIANSLKSLKLDSRGSKDVLKKRLKNFYKNQKLPSVRLKDPTVANSCRYHYVCVIDFEATCEATKSPSYKSEIIEFPAVVIDVREMKLGAEFQEYCRPILNPKLSTFCTELTGITQSDVDNADCFPDVLKRFEEWMIRNELSKLDRLAFLTDGPWDLGRFLTSQCQISDIPFPKYAKKWINLRKSYCNFYHCQRTNLQGMLEGLGMQFEGRPHSGIDDSRNIARIAVRLLQDGANLRVNERLDVGEGKQMSSRPLIVPVTRNAPSSQRR